MQFNTDIDFVEIPGVKGNLGIITLQRQQALNALSHEMCLAFSQKLITWRKKDAIKAVIIQAAPGRAFCAGGDIRAAYEKKIKNDSTLVDFFQDEYELNRQIFHFPKPYIAFLDGITMGGGAGISIHGSHCVGTPNMSFAMPETSIGFFPDVGASYFLPRLPFKMGYYLGLTGVVIRYNDCLALGLIDAVISADAQALLIQRLAQTALPNPQTVSDIIQEFSITAPPSALLSHRNEIEICFSKDSMAEIIEALESAENSWCRQTAENIKTKSPSSLRMTLYALQQGNHLDFDACMAMENRLLCYFLQSHDFFEGIRAALIDKDHAPQWEPALSPDAAVDVTKIKD
ncbi:MAG: crt 3 [Gammaproteobacteria bacterium]|jgi:enoyl-CoA hydratase/carnithine racemase|nr:crt 3 [Gammaproteobacteria bacterium]